MTPADTRREWQRAWRATPEGKAKTAAYALKSRKHQKEKYHTDPEWRAKRLASQSTPEAREKINARARARAATPEGRAARNDTFRRWHYSMSKEQLGHFKSTNICESCGDPVSGRNKHVDHDHTTGRYRGVLCSGCNTAEGQLKSDPARAMKLFEYMLRCKQCAR